MAFCVPATLTFRRAGAEKATRPVGVTEGPDGSLYISDDKGGRIWRVVFVGSRGHDDEGDDDDR